MRVAVLLLLVLFVFDANAQQYPLDSKRDYQWCFGYGSFAIRPWGRTVMNFNSSPPDTAYYAADPDIDNENVSLSDTNGNLLFYCNGNDVYGINHWIIQNGDSINCCNSYFYAMYGYGYPHVQGMIALPAPGFPNRHYLIYKPVNLQPSGVYTFPELHYTMIEKDAAGNNYHVVEKNQVFFTGLLSHGEITACRHANGRDWWILQRKKNSTFWRTFLLDPSGISLHHSQTIGDTLVDYFGQTIFTPDGTKYIAAGVYNDLAFADSFVVAVYDFNRCNGMLSNQDVFAFKDSFSISLGAAVSPNSQFLYLSEQQKVVQFDLQAPDWKTTKTDVSFYDGFVDITGGSILKPTRFQWMQLAPDNKIYIVAGNTTYLHTIDNPDSAGVACSVNQHSFRLSSLNAYSIPNFPNYRLGPIDGSLCDTLGIDVIAEAVLPQVSFMSDDSSVCETGCVQFNNQSTDADAVQWFFPGGTPSISTEASPNVCYTQDGTYDVTLIATNAFGSDTFAMTNYITVHPAVTNIIPYLSNDTLFTVGQFAQYQWFLDGVTATLSFDSFCVVTLPGTYAVIVTDANGCTGQANYVITDIEQVQPVSDFNFSLHPNPGFDQFTCTYNPLPRQAVVEVFDAVGRLRLSVAAGVGSTVVSTKALPAGFYVVKLVSEGRPLAKASWVKTQ